MNTQTSSVTMHLENSVLRCMISGEIDHHNARTVRTQIDETLQLKRPMRLELDLSQVAFMDSSGIAVVMRTRSRMQQLGGRLKLRSTAHQVRKVFDAAGISRLVEME